MRYICNVFLLCGLYRDVVLAFAPAFAVARRIKHDIGRTILHKSLFDDDEDDDTNNDSASRPSAPNSRKFTGQDYFSDSSRGTVGSDPRGTGAGTSSNRGSSAPMTPRDRMRQREFNLVSLATSPAAYAVQAASVLVLLVFIVYVGATGQLGLNNDYEDDDYFNYDPETVVVPESMIAESKESVWL